MPSVTNNRLILKNTLMLYIRQILVLVVGLYTSRVVLKVLGTVDFGIFNVVAGVVTMLGFLSNAMTTACQRYFSFDIGKDDETHLRQCYGTSFVIYFIIGCVIVVVCETVGLWFVNHKLVIPVERLFAARVVLQLSLITFVITIMTTPFSAIITAHEDMSIYAWMSIAECVVKLALVLLLSRARDFDGMIFYGLIWLFIAILNFLSYGIICRKKYAVCRSRFTCSLPLIKEMLRFTVWNMLSGISGALYNQGLNMVLNIFCGPIVNSARAIAGQVNGAVTNFAGRFSSAVQPQLIKNYAVKDYPALYRQLYRGIKLTYVLMFIFTLPLALEMTFVLHLWLGEFPEFTPIFTVLTLIATCISVTTYSLDTLAQATGYIRLYQVFVSGITLLNVPVDIFVLHIGLPPYSVIVVNIMLECVAVFLRVIILRVIAERFSLREYALKTLVPIIFVTVFSVPLPHLAKMFIHSTVIQFCSVVGLSCALIALLSYTIMLDVNERQAITEIIRQKIFHKRRIA